MSQTQHTPQPPTRVPRSTTAAESGSDAAARRTSVQAQETGSRAAAGMIMAQDRAGVRPARRGIQFTAQRLFGSLFLLFVAMLVTYMAGVMVGRHQLDTELLLARSLPEEPAAQMADKAEAKTKAKGAKASQAEDEEENEDKEETFSILKPQELAFSRFLRAAPGEKVSEPKPLEIFKPIMLPSTNSTRRVDVPVPMAPGMSPATAGGGPPEKPEQAADLYDFVFQVAAFRSAEDAEETRIQLEAEGFRSRLEHNGRLYLVLLLSRGPLSRIAEIHDVTQRLHLGMPIERSRKAVLRPIGAR